MEIECSVCGDIIGYTSHEATIGLTVICRECVELEGEDEP